MCIVHHTGEHLDVKSAKIVAGMEPEKTNYMLQMLARAQVNARLQRGGASAERRRRSKRSCVPSSSLSGVSNSTHRPLSITSTRSKSMIVFSLQYSVIGEGVVRRGQK